MLIMPHIFFAKHGDIPFEKEQGVQRGRQGEAAIDLSDTGNYKVFRLKAEGSELSRKARIKQLKTFSVSMTFGSTR